jgi:hypothetical protein
MLQPWASSSSESNMKLIIFSKIGLTWRYLPTHIRAWIQLTISVADQCQCLRTHVSHDSPILSIRGLFTKKKKKNIMRYVTLASTRFRLFSEARKVREGKLIPCRPRSIRKWKTIPGLSSNVRLDPGKWSLLRGSLKMTHSTLHVCNRTRNRSYALLKASKFPNRVQKLTVGITRSKKTGYGKADILQAAAVYYLKPLKQNVIRYAN